jgi:phage terminase Nu1 subunit (DNA packaging protein)
MDLDMSTILNFEDDFLAILGGQVAPDGPPGLIGSPPAGDSVIRQPEIAKAKEGPLAGNSGAIPESLGEEGMARLLGCTASHIRTLSREGHLVKAGRARWNVRASLLTYLEHIRQLAVKRGRTDDPMKLERIRVLTAQAQKIEMQNQIAAGEMLQATAVEREWANLLRDVRSALLAVPSRCGASLPHLTAHDIVAVDREIKSALEGLANGND